MKISGGHLKGRSVASRKLFSKKNDEDELRPTSSKVREAVFNILQKEITGSDFLDLYSGTGAIGFEALSRGSERVVFVECNNIRARNIQDNISKIGLNNKAVVYREKTLDFLNKTFKSGEKYDIIFADPPYASDEIMSVMEFIAVHDIVRHEGCLIVEHSSKKDYPDAFGSLRFAKNYRYGDTTLTLYRKAK